MDSETLIDGRTETESTDDAADVPGVTKVGFILEVAAESRAALGDKLYGYDDIEADRVAAGYHPHDDSIDCTHPDIPVMKDERDAVRAEEVTVNDLLVDASFNGHGVLFKTDGTNLGSPSEATEIPHFGHGSGTCDDVDACDGEGVYRLFPSADLILDGNAGRELVGSYKLRDDVVVTLSGPTSNPTPGQDPATPVDLDER